MDIFNKTVDIWKTIDDNTDSIFESKIIINNETIGRDNNFLSSIVKSSIILNGKLNELHIISAKATDVSHYVILMTPQPIKQYSQIELSTTKQFVSLIGSDTVGIVDISNMSLSKTCKKVKEVFKTKDDIISVKWYPQLYDCLVVLTRQSLNIFKCCSDLRIVTCFQYYLTESLCGRSQSFGIKEEFIAFDFGSSDTNSDDNKLFVLTDSGDILLLPELRSLTNNSNISPKKLLFSPPSVDNYQDDFTSLLILRGSLDILVMVNRNGCAQHAIIINDTVCVYETVNIVTLPNLQSGPVIIADRHSNPPRYLLLHPLGIHSCVLPWAVRIRLMMSQLNTKLTNATLNEAGNAIIDHTIDTVSTQSSKGVKIRGVSVVRAAMDSPEVAVFISGNERKSVIKTRLRQESSLMVLDNDERNVVRDDRRREASSSKHSWPISRDSHDMFLRAVLAELGRGGLVPHVAANVDDRDEAGEAKVALVLKISERITSDFGARLESAGKIFDQRLEQIKSVIELQQDQVKNIELNREKLQIKSKKLVESFHLVSSRQKILLDRLSKCSNRLAAMNNTIPMIDREAATSIRNVEKKIAGMESLLRSCKVRFEQNRDFIDEMKKKEKENVSDMSTLDRERTEEFLCREDEVIKELVEQVRGLMS